MRRWLSKPLSSQGLQHAHPLATFFDSVLQHLSDITCAIRVACAPFLKQLDHRGYDLWNPLLDYGNYQYKTPITCWAWVNPQVERAITQFASFWHIMMPKHTDTKTALNNQGDMVEECMAICHDHGAWGVRSMYSNQEWTSAYSYLCSFCRSIDCLYCYVLGGRASKTHPHTILESCPMEWPMRRRIGNSSTLMADLWLSLVNSEFVQIFNWEMTTYTPHLSKIAASLSRGYNTIAHLLSIFI